MLLEYIEAIHFISSTLARVAHTHQAMKLRDLPQDNLPFY